MKLRHMAFTQMYAIHLVCVHCSLKTIIFLLSPAQVDEFYISYTVAIFFPLKKKNNLINYSVDVRSYFQPVHKNMNT